MSWTAPATFTDGNVLSAADMNTFLRDNMLETMPGKATGQLRHYIADGANRIIERQIVKEYIEVADVTSSTSYGDLGTVGPSITLVASQAVLVFWTMYVENNTAGATNCSSIDVSGATVSGPADSKALMIPIYTADKGRQVGMADIIAGLAPGTHTFKLQYRVDSGTGKFAKRSLIVIAL